MDTQSKIFVLSLTSINSMFMMYHYGSYVSNPVMLRSSKPMLMRDVFLTKCTGSIPNPLSFLYNTGWKDTLGIAVVHTFCAAPVVQLIGWRHALIVYVGSGWMSSFAYQFQNQINSRKRSTNHDCTCTSSGATAGLCMLSAVLPKCYVPLSKRAPAFPIAFAWWAKCLYDEYVSPQRRVPGEVVVSNWGSVGGVFFSMMFASLCLRTKADFGALRRLYSNMNGGTGAARRTQ